MWLYLGCVCVTIFWSEPVLATFYTKMPSINLMSEDSNKAHTVLLIDLCVFVNSILNHNIYEHGITDIFDTFTYQKKYIFDTFFSGMSCLVLYMRQTIYYFYLNNIVQTQRNAFLTRIHLN